MCKHNLNSVNTPRCWGKSQVLRRLLLLGKMDAWEEGRVYPKGYGRGNKRQTDEEREVTFWSRVKLHSSGCWFWTGSTSDGYPSFYLNGKAQKGARVVWQFVFGEIPKGMKILHKCDVRQCCNPLHLFCGTIADNNKDRAQKGRNNHVHGTQHPLSKLNDSIVRQIRKLRTMGYLLREIARMFDVGETTIHSIVSQRTWGWLKE